MAKLRDGPVPRSDAWGAGFDKLTCPTCGAGITRGRPSTVRGKTFVMYLFDCGHEFMREVKKGGSKP